MNGVPVLLPMYLYGARAGISFFSAKGFCFSSATGLKQH